MATAALISLCSTVSPNMHSFLKIFGACATLTSIISATPIYDARSLDSVLDERQAPGNSTLSNSLVVDLGYEQYQGVRNASSELNNWFGMRFAAPPTGKLRWQKPQTPAQNRGQVLPANVIPQNCPQSPANPLAPGFNYTGNEDCLFLSVYAPQNKTNLPVLVWIHGGGYGMGQGNQDLSSIINTNNNSFIGVAIQYRLGAFGFMSSGEIKQFGAVNAGLLDQHFALQWVQQHISKFGGDPSRVTISGESAGGGSVMLQAMAYGGNLSDTLFDNVISASPYLPQQFGYADFVPSQSYYAFASAVGCFTPALAQNNVNNSIFECLVSKDTITLQNASAAISASSRFGTWGFLPVTDGEFVQQLPSQQLLKKQINGKRMLAGNNANEGPAFTPQTVKTEDDFVNFIRNSFPLFTEADVAKVLQIYPSSNASVDPSALDFATAGNSTPTALNESTFGTGQQQRADNLYAETTFVCPSYWLAEAYSGNDSISYKYQFSVIPANHGADVNAYFGPPQVQTGPEFVRAFQTIWGNFVVNNNPSISATIANGANSTSTTNPATDWPQYSDTQPYQMNLNETGGTPFVTQPLGPTSGNTTEFEDPGLMNAIDLVNAYTWEGGRGARCDFWRSVGLVVPE